MAWECRKWSQLAKVDENERLVATNTWEHECHRRFGPHRSSFVVAYVRPGETGGWEWQVRAPYVTVAKGYEENRSRAQAMADVALREAKVRETARRGR